MKRTLMELGDFNVVILRVDMRVFSTRDAWLPPGCMMCGDEFDWDGIFTVKAKICPDCKVIYPQSANFCIFHGTKDMKTLQDIEYRK